MTEVILDKRLGRVGIIGRFKPLHLGGYVLLKSACNQSDIVTIGIGSSNKYNVRNPFTADESEQMIYEALMPYEFNFTIKQIPDFAHLGEEYKDGKRWKEHVVGQFGELDYFLTGNSYVAGLLGDTYNVMHPTKIIPKKLWIKLRASEVRLRMAQGDDKWKKLVPEKVVDYLEKNGIVDRFVKEFGLESIASLANADLRYDENVVEEKLHTWEV